MLLLCSSTVLANFSAVRIDDFHRADNTDIGSAWDPVVAGRELQIVSEKIESGGLGGRKLESYGAVSFPDDQWARVTFVSWGGSTVDRAGVTLRCASPGTYTCYNFIASINDGTQTSAIELVSAGTTSTLVSDTTQTWAANDTLTGEAIGNTLKLYRNGSVVLTTTDSSLTSGRPGMFLLIDPTGNLTDVEMDYWIGGEFTSCDQRVLDTNNADRRVVDTDNAIVRVTDTCTSAVNPSAIKKLQRYELYYQEPL